MGLHVVLLPRCWTPRRAGGRACSSRHPKARGGTPGRLLGRKRPAAPPCRPVAQQRTCTRSVAPCTRARSVHARTARKPLGHKGTTRGRGTPGAPVAIAACRGKTGHRVRQLAARPGIHQRRSRTRSCCRWTAWSTTRSCEAPRWALIRMLAAALRSPRALLGVCVPQTPHRGGHLRYRLQGQGQAHGADRGPQEGPLRPVRQQRVPQEERGAALRLPDACGSAPCCCCRSRDGVPVTTIREMRVLQQCQHPNIVRLIKIVTGSKADRCAALCTSGRKGDTSSTPPSINHWPAAGRGASHAPTVFVQPRPSVPSCADVTLSPESWCCSVFLVFEFCDFDLGRVLDAKPQPFTLPQVKQLMQQVCCCEGAWERTGQAGARFALAHPDPCECCVAPAPRSCCGPWPTCTAAGCCTATSRRARCGPLSLSCDRRRGGPGDSSWRSLRSSNRRKELPFPPECLADVRPAVLLCMSNPCCTAADVKPAVLPQRRAQAV